MSLLDRSKALAQSTWRCEFPVHSGRGNGIQARRADTAEQALVWMRLSVRALISALDPEDQDGAFRWLDHGQWMTIMRLKAGAPYTFTARAGESQVEWSARPVVFLPVSRARASGSSPRAGSALRPSRRSS